MANRTRHLWLLSACAAALLAAAPASSEQGKGTARPPGASPRIIQKGGDLVDEKGAQPKPGTSAPAITSPRDPASGQATGRR
jgi:hypothetical protein